LTKPQTSITLSNHLTNAALKGLIIGHISIEPNWPLERRRKRIKWKSFGSTGFGKHHPLSENISTASAQIDLRYFGNPIHPRMSIRSEYHPYACPSTSFAKSYAAVCTVDHGQTGGNPSFKKWFMTARAMIHHRRHPRSDAQNDPQKPYHLRRGKVKGNESGGKQEAAKQDRPK
jgi:hypothetical protein